MAMPQKPQKPKAYTQETLEEAIELVKNKKMSLNGASKAFGIPYATLGDKVRGRRPVLAPPRTVLSPVDEKKLVNWLLHLAQRGFGRTREDLKDMVKQILDERKAKSIFKDNRPGKVWVQAFFARHPELSVRTSQPLGRERSMVSRDSLQTWYRDMKAYVDSIDSALLNSPDRIFNADESGFSVCPKTKKVISQTGAKHIYAVTSGSRQQVTVLACISANGRYLKPLLIFPYKRDPPYNALDGFEEAYFNKSDNGWITEAVFLSFLKDVLIPHLEQEGTKRPVIVFVDGHSSHLSLQVCDLCRKEEVVLYCLKAHSSHLTQPLDQAFFGAIKPAWTEQVRKFQYENTESVTLRTFAGVLKKAWDTAARPETAIKGFSKSGLFPYNPDTVLQSEKLKPSCTFVPGPPSTSDNPIPTTSSSSIVNPLPSICTSSSVNPQPSTSKSAPSPASSRSKLESQKKLFSLNFALGEDKTRLYLKRYEEEYDPKTDNDYNTWSSLMDHVINPSLQPLPPPPQPPAEPQLSTSRSIDDLLTMPSCPKKKGVKRSQPPLPYSISGHEYREMLLEKRRKIEEEQRQKEERKREREEKKKERLAQAEQKKIRQEEKKKERELAKKTKEEMKKKKREEKELKALLAGSQKLKKDSEESSDSELEPVYDDNSDDEVEDITDNCHQCGLTTRQEVCIQCTVCDKWWHANCVIGIDLTNKSQEDLDAMNIPFVCTCINQLESV